MKRVESGDAKFKFTGLTARAALPYASAKLPLDSHQNAPLFVHILRTVIPIIRTPSLFKRLSTYFVLSLPFLNVPEPFSTLEKIEHGSGEQETGVFL